MGISCSEFSKSATVSVVMTCLVDIPGLVMNFFTVVCLIQINLSREQAASGSHMFAYLLSKAVVDLSIILIDIFFIRYNLNSSMRSSLAGNIWNVYFYSYAESCLWYISSLMEIAASLDCLISIGRRFKWLLSTVSFYLIVAFSVAFSFLFHIYMFYQNYVATVVTNTTVNGTVYQVVSYRSSPTRFRVSQVGFNLITAETIIRDGVFLSIIILLNLMILFEIRKVTKRRIGMQGSITESLSQQQPTTHSKLVKTAMNAEKNKGLMIVMTGVNYFLGHAVYAIYQIATSVGINPGRQTEWLCAYRVGLELMMISFCTSFFLYYFFNTQFKKCAKHNIQTLISPFKKLLGL